MLSRKITSRQHPLVKHLVSLRETSAYRSATGSCLITSSAVLRELPRHWRVKLLLVTEGYPCPDREAESTIEIPEELMQKITGLMKPGPVAAEVAMPTFLRPLQELESFPYLLLLDGVSDPGNCGTLLRTAHCLGWQGAIFTEGSVDPFNDKALRAGKTAPFHLPLAYCSRSELLAWLGTSERTLLVADANGIPLDSCQIGPPLLLALGNEGHGSQLRDHPQATPISIPMEERSESLNVGAAGAILMHQLRRAL